MPLQGGFGLGFIIEGRPLEGPAHGGGSFTPISANYFNVFKIPVLRGRYFTEQDTTGAPGVVIINQTMARQYWPDGNPIGERLIIGRGLGPNMEQPPAEIVGIAEENGSIALIGDCILSKSIASLAVISRLDGLADTYLAVNFSPLQFEPALPSRLAALLLENGITPSRIVVEITEAVLMLDNPVVREVLDALSDLGCRIALDDFGTGYSSLSYLNRFPVDIVKVDQSFTRSLSSDQPDVRRKSRMLVEGIRTISHQMGCAVVAEGIETTEQWDILQSMDIEFGQGYLLSKPLPLEALLEKLDEFTKPDVPGPRAMAS